MYQMYHSNPSTPRFTHPQKYVNVPRYSTPTGIGPASPMNSLLGALRPNTSFLQPTYNPPRLPVFSGAEDNQSTSYEVWNFEVKCLINSQQYPEYLIAQAIRNSLRGTARNMLVSLGENATVRDILNKLDGFYGNVNTSETLMQSFYNDEQGGETVVVYGSRLEDKLSKAIQGRSELLPARDIMLKSKFWNGLRKNLKEATSHLLDSTSDFQTLLREVRKVEQEVSSVKERSGSASSVTQQIQIGNSEMQQVLKAVKELSVRMETMESKIVTLQHEMKNKLIHRDGSYENMQSRFNRSEQKGAEFKF
ncbi:hypothetical protein KUTeg_002721 [Tegillarca granosa]|uniref:Paraneoplastic antigen Ma-like C-terminal domain-containing protein n=1 Tax=Tegillarca granosa TaxID=220873 RepID=A0ABQ9FUS2_TEGGR|nr:hypothetical protein KUTeg_002721 [Tegillarca granosa]